ncbi:D-amino acid dehydrogenase [Dongia sedimenti]|uniref:D-amino acid dehydrogenase n=1 Tax=Dongia sedimenti TaxID=3064282 RepID=A0ABU0YV82_9PROT|nr:D-amino acid dehydrogenase [Rhodospirillaceae bacterium R-7]
MRVVVLGAGLIGTATAYYLARAGHEVVVIDRQRQAGLETSFANGALLTPSTSDSWAAPGTPQKILKWFGQEDAPMLLRLRAVPGMIGWGLRFLRECRPERWEANTEAVLKLALFSMAALDRLQADEALEFDRNPPGLIKLFRDPLSMDSALRASALYQRLGVDCTALEPDGCVAVEPALRPIRDKISGGVHYPADGSGDALKFTQALAERARALGVSFLFGHEITGFSTESDRVTAVETNQGAIRGEAFVLALGSFSTLLGRKLGLSLPVYPAKGYSITVAAPGWNGAPRIPIADDGRKVAVVPLGDRLRVAGTVEFDGYETRLNSTRGRMLVDGLGDIYPDYPREGRIEHWSGLRPLTPDGRPIIGRSRWRNLFLNTGHGPLGWTLAAGSGLAMAELVAGNSPSIDLASFSPER